MEKQVTFSTHITQQEFTRFNYYTFYSQPIGIILTIIGVGMWIAVLYYFFNPTIMGDQFPLTQLIFAIFATILMPLFIYRNARKNYHKKSRIIEEMHYFLNEDWIEIKGETFQSKLNWEKIYKVKETKSWFLIYTSKVVSYVIIKNDLNKEQLLVFRTIIQKIPNLKTSLK